MKAYVINKPNDGMLADIPVPELRPGYVLAKVRYVGLCGTDFSIYTGELSYAKAGMVIYPHILGHEWAGTVEAVGEGVTNVKVGDRVISDTGVGCGECELCKAGKFLECKNGRSLGTVGNYWPGCYVEHFLLPAAHLHILPDHVSLMNATLVEPAAISYDCIHQFKALKGGTFLVYGTGAIGMSAIALAKYMGATKVFHIGRSDEKLALGRKLGADYSINSRTCDPVAKVMELTDGLGVDCTFETTGVSSCLNTVFGCTRRKGEVGMVAFYENYNEQVNLDMIVDRNLRIHGATGSRYATEKTFEAVCNGVDFTPMVSHVIPFDDVPDAFAKPDSTRTKIVAYFGDEPTDQN